MKKPLILAIGLLISQNAFAAELTTNEQKASYTLGTDMAKNLTQQGLTIDAEAFSLGVKDALSNKPSRLSEEEMMKAIAEVKKTMMQKQEAMRKQQAEANLAAGKQFMAEHGKQDGVKTLDNGIQYKIIKSGKGESPTENDTIFAHYEGTFIDGKVFDSSYQRGTPLKFQMGNVIKGWGEVLKMMKPGDKWEVVIPSELAYGERGAGQAIGPNQTLRFTIELIQFTSDNS
ncbi:FKBP-type peptidyl-prolyl cis-trans isomerase [Thiomicrorhabdus sediminis]|uniref:Peptidyl-prolyl cis-trans isomerase n=1 Tax=Thiomicrorhabdus sediminis TaxID=2580412 RepID=A0A4P9K4J7_9GAMM|nr:FKBP-type peptidyl-prolyl cis-trans isomerase [Thiomicrorhabdus sediminis]QCU89859.1 FKBP-type peptidyl-prolyl cis-trans isomerase [Thiomicrorhabdus sediminis]